MIYIAILFIAAVSAAALSMYKEKNIKKDQSLFSEPLVYLIYLAAGLLFSIFVPLHFSKVFRPVAAFCLILFVSLSGFFTGLSIKGKNPQKLFRHGNIYLYETSFFLMNGFIGYVLLKYIFGSDSALQLALIYACLTSLFIREEKGINGGGTSGGFVFLPVFLAVMTALITRKTPALFPLTQFSMFFEISMIFILSVFLWILINVFLRRTENTDSRKLVLTGLISLAGGLSFAFSLPVFLTCGITGALVSGNYIKTVNSDSFSVNEIKDIKIMAERSMLFFFGYNLQFLNSKLWDYFDSAIIFAFLVFIISTGFKLAAVFLFPPAENGNIKEKMNIFRYLSYQGIVPVALLFDLKNYGSVSEQEILAAVTIYVLILFSIILWPKGTAGNA